MKPSPLYNSMKIEGGLIGAMSRDTNRPLMSAELLADNKEFPQVSDCFWERQYRRGEWPAFCYEN